MGRDPSHLGEGGLHAASGLNLSPLLLKAFGSLGLRPRSFGIERLETLVPLCERVREAVAGLPRPPRRTESPAGAVPVAR